MFGNEDSIVDSKVEISEINEPELEAVEKNIEPELKAEDETFDETEEVGNFKAEQDDQSEHDVYESRIQSSLNGDYWRQPKQITGISFYKWKKLRCTNPETPKGLLFTINCFELSSVWLSQ